MKNVQSVGSGCSLSWCGHIHGPEADEDDWRGGDGGGEGCYDQQGGQDRHLQGGGSAGQY